MSTEKTDALVIRQADFSESSRVVTFFTRDFGKISAVAKGAKRLKGPFEAALDLLAASRIVFIRKSTASLDILTEAQLASRFRPSPGSLFGLYGGYYAAELLSGLMEEYDPHPAVYDAAVRLLGCLSNDEQPKLSLLRFELLLLREIGHLPAFDVCVACGEPARGHESYGFWVSQGGLICGDCQQQEYRQNQIQAGTVAVLQRLSAESENATNRLQVSDKQLQEMRQVVTAAISHILGHRPKMMRYLQDSGVRGQDSERNS